MQCHQQLPQTWRGWWAGVQPGRLQRQRRRTRAAHCLAAPAARPVKRQRGPQPLQAGAAGFPLQPDSSDQGAAAGGTTMVQVRGCPRPIDPRPCSPALLCVCQMPHHPHGCGLGPRARADGAAADQHHHGCGLRQHALRAVPGRLGVAGGAGGVGGSVLPHRWAPALSCTGASTLPACFVIATPLRSRCVCSGWFDCHGKHEQGQHSKHEQTHQSPWHIPPPPPHGAAPPA